MRLFQIALILILTTFYGCKQDVKEAKYKGTWIDKDLLARKNSNSSFLADTSTRFPLILFEKEQDDSVLFYYDKNRINTYDGHYAFDSYYIHFDKTDEYFLVYDYKTDEIVFSNLKDDEFYRFVKVDTLLKRKDIVNPDFDINSFIQTLK